MLAQGLLDNQFCRKALFVFRGKGADKLKIVWWDGQGFCLYYKCLDRGKFVWPKSEERDKLGITRGQLAMLIEAIDWRNPTWLNQPARVG